MLVYKKLFKIICKKTAVSAILKYLIKLNLLIRLPSVNLFKISILVLNALFKIAKRVLLRACKL